MRSRRISQSLFAAVAVSSVLVLSGCSSVASPFDEPARRGPYNAYQSLCVVPAQKHAYAYDLELVRMLRDRGFKPELLESSDLNSIRRCRAIVTFSTGDTKRLFDAPSEMALTFVDAYTGETYHVAAARAMLGDTGVLAAASPLTDPAVMIHKLVERLFPDPS